MPSLPPIPAQKFEPLHDAFLARMLEKGGTPFVSFNHPFLVADEIEYKQRVYYRARDVLELETWKEKDIGSGKILNAMRGACAPAVSRNLLEHKYGNDNGSYKALYRARSVAQRRDLEAHLYACLRQGDATPERFGPRFDALADFLREHQLGARWEFMTYIAFLRDSRRYFPIRSTRFQGLLDFLGYDVRLSGKATWDRYVVLLELAEQLRERLAAYGPASAVDIPSYMRVLSYLIDELPKRPRRT